MDEADFARIPSSSPIPNCSTNDAPTSIDSGLSSWDTRLATISCSTWSKVQALRSLRCSIGSGFFGRSPRVVSDIRPRSTPERQYDICSIQWPRWPARQQVRVPNASKPRDLVLTGKEPKQRPSRCIQSEICARPFRDLCTHASVIPNTTPRIATLSPSRLKHLALGMQMRKTTGGSLLRR